MEKLNSKHFLKQKLAGRQIERNLFCPAIYEHKAALIGKGVSHVCQSADLLEQAALAEYETYNPDIITVGIDVYNIEAEALGCEIYFPNEIQAVPIVSKRILENINDYKKLQVINPEAAGRMSLMLKAADAVNKQIGNEVHVRGAICGPYSLASELLGVENMIMALVLQPDDAKKLLDFCTNIAIIYGREYLKRGLQVCIFDSQSSPPLISPQLYKDIILPFVQHLIAELKAEGSEFVEYVAGGKTDSIAESLFESGADIILSDFNSNIKVFLQYSKNTSALIRKNISPILISNGSQEQLDQEINQAKYFAANYNNIIIGTGVISYNTNPKKILKIKSKIVF